MTETKYRSPSRLLLEGAEGVALLAGAFCTWPVSRRWLNDWGSSHNERRREWPGDHLVAPGSATSTRAIAIAAPAETVWKWVVQFGLGRAGFYSYELLERVAGIPVKNLECIEQAFQSIEVGDEVKLHPSAPGIPVASVEPGRQICFGAELGGATTTEHPGRSWSIYIEPIADETCRLIIRGCLEAPDGWMGRIGVAVEAPLDFVMEQRMLRTIKRLAEAKQLDVVVGGSPTEAG